MHKYLVDTDVIVNYFLGKEKARNFLLKIIAGKNKGFFSVITESELLSGARNIEEEMAIQDILDSMEAIEVNREIAKGAGKIRQKYYVMHKASIPDAIIAATAQLKKLIVATANREHFKIFEEIKKKYVQE